MEKQNLTEEEYWNDCYIRRMGCYEKFDENNWKDLTAIKIVEKISTLMRDKENILEIGGGDAKVICYLARKNRNKKFSIIDYSEIGCKLALERANRENVIIGIYKSDMFSPPKEILNSFDFVFSFGVAEHFCDLSSFLEAKKKFLKIRGIMLTVVPNLKSPIYGILCRLWNKDVYGKHIKHDLISLQKGHEKVNLKIREAGYIGSIEFGMLSMAIVKSPDPKKVKSFIYLWLTRFSKIIHFFEYSFLRLPPSYMFSPFLYVVAEKEDAK